jgi:hypothetical protein
MAEEITKYTVSVSFDAALKKLATFEKKMDKVSNKQKASLKSQIALQTRLNALRSKGNTLALKSPTAPPRASPITQKGSMQLTPIAAAVKQQVVPPSTKVDKSVDNFLEQKGLLQQQKVLSKDLENSLDKRISKQNTLSKAMSSNQKMSRIQDKGIQDKSKPQLSKPDPMIAHLKAREKHLLKIQARESGPDKMTSHLKAREKQLLKNAAIEEKRIASLERAKKSFQRSALFRDKARNSAEGELRAQMKIRLQSAKTADKVKQIVSDHRTALGVLRKQGAALKKNSFLMNRMKNSSQQFAGNMIGAFAIAAAGTSIVKTGQDIESVNNTMLAVSDNASMAGDNFQFVRKEAFRLGLGLAESGKNFAKMLSARGNMSLDDTKAAFSGVAEMSTLLGLSAEQSNRAINALQQIDHCLAS